MAIVFFRSKIQKYAYFRAKSGALQVAHEPRSSSLPFAGGWLRARAGNSPSHPTIGDVERSWQGRDG